MVLTRILLEGEQYHQETRLDIVGHNPYEANLVRVSPTASQRFLSLIPDRQFAWQPSSQKTSPRVFKLFLYGSSIRPNLDPKLMGL